MIEIEYNFCYLPHYCSCPDHELMILDPNKIKRYEREGYPKFIRGHEHKGKIPWNKDKPWDEETLKKITKANQERIQSLDYIHPFKGKTHTPEAKEKNRIAHLGNKNAEGHIVSEENKILLSELHTGNQYAKGCVHSEESNLKQSISMKEKDPWNKGLVGVQESPMKGKNHTPESIKKIKENTTIYNGGDHWNWQGGKSFEPYCLKFNNDFKSDVRKRDNHICQLCGKTEVENGEKLSVHHIHYDKQNCYPDCVALCRHCNMHEVEKKDTKNYYENLFMNKLNDRCLLFWSRRRMSDSKIEE